MTDKTEIQEAPIHAKLRAHSDEPTVEGLRALLDEHHSEFPPSPVWAPNLLLVLEHMQSEIDELRGRLEVKK
jgi:hypothetical protein